MSDWPEIIDRCRACGVSRYERAYGCNGRCMACWRARAGNVTRLPEEVTDASLAELERDPIAWLTTLVGHGTLVELARGEARRLALVTYRRALGEEAQLYPGEVISRSPWAQIREDLFPEALEAGETTTARQRSQARAASRRRRGGHQ